jgi:hypothetical protein
VFLLLWNSARGKKALKLSNYALIWRKVFQTGHLQALLIFERKIFRILYGPKYEDGEWKIRKNRELEEFSKGENIVKWIKGQRISGWVSWREWRMMGCPNELHSRTGRDETKRKTQERMDRRSRERSSSSGHKKMELAIDRENGEVFFDRPKPTAGCSANGRRTWAPDLHTTYKWAGIAQLI